MFLHDYLLACEISTVRTQTLKTNNIDEMNPTRWSVYSL